MEIKVDYKPSYALATIKLNDGEQIKAEGGAMVSMSSNINMETQRAEKKGFWKSLKSAALGGESFWMNVFTAQGSPGEVSLAPMLPGDISHVTISKPLFVQSGSFVACSPGLEMDTEFQGLKGFFSGESLFFLKFTGSGDILLSSYGSIEEIDINGTFIVDTGHIVAFEEGLNYEISRVQGGWKSFLFSGEGLIAKFTGSGKLWMQTRNVPDLTAWLSAQLPPKKQ